MRDNPLRQLLGSIESGDRAWTAMLGRLDELDLEAPPLPCGTVAASNNPQVNQ